MDGVEVIDTLERIAATMPDAARRDVVAILDLRPRRQVDAIGELRRSGRAPELAALLMRLHAHQSTNGLYAAHMREILGRDLDLT